MTDNKHIEHYDVARPETLGSLRKKFCKVYGLTAEYESGHHDAIHAMTGTDVSVYSETIDRIYDNHLRGSLFSIEEPGATRYTPVRFYEWAVRAAYVRERAFPSPLNHIFNQYAPPPSLLMTEEWKDIQRQTPLITKAEIRDHKQLAEQIDRDIRRFSGKAYRHLTLEEVDRLYVDNIDYSAEVEAIRRRHQTAAYTALREKAAEILHQRSMELRGQPMPKAGPWHGPASRFYQRFK